MRLAAEHGAGNVTVEAISEAAGVSPRTFFNYFDTRDDAFVMIDSEVVGRIRRGLLDASAELSPLEALRDVLAAELAEVEARHELWALRAKVLHKSPHLLVRSLGAHMADERVLAEAVAERLGTQPPLGPGSGDKPVPELYPRLVAGVSGAAVRVSIEHWCAQPGKAGDLTFSEIFQQVFAHLAAGLQAPSAQPFPEAAA